MEKGEKEIPIEEKWDILFFKRIFPIIYILAGISLLSIAWGSIFSDILDYNLPIDYLLFISLVLGGVYFLLVGINMFKQKRLSYSIKIFGIISLIILAAFVSVYYIDKFIKDKDWIRVSLIIFTDIFLLFILIKAYINRDKERTMFSKDYNN